VDTYGHMKKKPVSATKTAPKRRSRAKVPAKAPAKRRARPLPTSAVVTKKRMHSVLVLAWMVMMLIVSVVGVLFFRYVAALG
jgi:hypothetical protein